MAGMIQVRRQEPMLVVPKNPTKNGIVVELSNIDDQQGLRGLAAVIMAFKGRPCISEAEAKKDPVIVIREALAKTLDFYYPFAGRMREDEHNQKLLVDCNGKGVLFIEADADVTLKDIETLILPPCPLLEDLIFDVPGSNGIIGCPLLLFQVTRLQCGGHILGIRFNHTMCDMLGLMQFLYAMVEFSRGAQKPSIMPVWQRDLLCARNPPRVTCTHHEYQKAGEITNVPILKKSEDNVVVPEGFFFDSQTIEVIRNHLPPHLRNSFSTFELICACVWRCRVLALQPDPEDTVQFSMTVSVRENNIISLPRGYYGNSFVSPAITTKAKELMCNIDNSLAHALQIVKNSREKASEEYVRSMIDLMEVEGRPKYKEHLCWMATNLTRKLLEFADFGWGTPTYSGIPQATSLVGTFTRFKNEQGKDVISVVLCLPKEVMLRFKMELGRVVGDHSRLISTRSSL